MKIGPESVANVSHISIESHTGTHIDAPLHFIKDGHTTAEIALSTLIGSCQVVYIPHVKSIGPDELKKIPFEKGIKRILFKTDNQHLWDKEEYTFLYLTGYQEICHSAHMWYLDATTIKLTIS